MVKYDDKPNASVVDALNKRLTAWRNSNATTDWRPVEVEKSRQVNALREAVAERVYKRVGMGLVRQEFPQAWLDPILDSLEEGVDQIYAEGGKAGCFAATTLAELVAIRFESLELEKRIVDIEKAMRRRS
jgi:hypothetical protein